MEMAEKLEIENVARIRKQDLIFAILKAHGLERVKIFMAMASWRF